MNSAPNVLFLLPYPVGHAPSQRFRVEQYFPVLQKAGVPYRLAPFLDEPTWQILYKGGSPVAKAWGVIKSYLRRWKTVLYDVPRYDYVFVHREAAPLGPPLVEWMVSKVWRKKMIFDFDDAIWIANTSSENSLAARLKCFWKVKYICKWSYKVAGGNDFLCNYARQSGAEQVFRIPTIVDTTRRYVPVIKDSKPLVLGWTGSHSTLKYLDMVMPVLQELEKEYDFMFQVIADKEPVLPLQKYTFVKWNPATEIEDLAKFDIGIMPLTDDAWSEGKCGFKLIQYMGMGIPAVASPVGVNKVIVAPGVNGFMATSPEEWKTALVTLMNDAGLRKEMGVAGRNKIVAEYSLASQEQPFLGLFK